MACIPTGGGSSSSEITKGTKPDSSTCGIPVTNGAEKQINASPKNKSERKLHSTPTLGKDFLIISLLRADQYST